MNKNNLNQIFNKYIEQFDFVNAAGREEYYKWQICNEFPTLMKKALESNDEEFRSALYALKKCTANIIDSYTQPLMGLVEFAKPDNDPARVRKMLKDLYADDGGDLKIQMEKISDFFKQSNELLDLYAKDSFLYKQNSHSVSALLFLNDPDNHYMYKAKQSKEFAECVEFYDDWGTGDEIKLDVYYRMCDELVSEIKENKALLDTDASRFDGRLKISGGTLHPDIAKHILAFDIIYCSTRYDLYSGIDYVRRDAKGKQLFLAEKAKAESLKEAYDKAKRDMDTFIDAREYFESVLSAGTKIEHLKNGIGTVKKIEDDRITIQFQEKEMKCGLMMLLANNLISIDNAEFASKIVEYKDVIKRHDSIKHAFEYAAKSLEPYKEYLE